jgi:hypothetical protein
VKQVPSQAVPVSIIEAMYAMDSMGRGAELKRLLELELPLLEQKLKDDHPAAPISLSQQMLKWGPDYILKLEPLGLGSHGHIEVGLNVSSSFFMVQFEGKHFNLITAKSICNLIYQLLSQGQSPYPETSTRLGVALQQNQVS